MKVLIPTPLHSYTRAAEVEATGDTLAMILADLEQQFPGLRFRIVDEQDRLRPHMRFFINQVQVFGLDHPLNSSDSIQIVQALSGG